MISSMVGKSRKWKRIITKVCKVIWRNDVYVHCITVMISWRYTHVKLFQFYSLNVGISIIPK